MELDLENPLSTTSIDAIPSLFHVESDQHPSQIKDLNVSFRRQAIALILNFTCNFECSVSYLAINYLDRFLSTISSPPGEPSVARLVAISCVSLAMKMMRKSECSVSDTQDGGGTIIDGKAVSRMEKLILGALGWRMRSITPFSFIDFFIKLFKFREDPPLVHALKTRATDIIFKAQADVELVEFVPSLIAASALLCASHELFPLQFPCFQKAISNCEYVNKVKLSRCYGKMEERAMGGFESVLEREREAMSSTSTPVNVLDLLILHSSSGSGSGSGSSSSSFSALSGSSEDAIISTSHRRQQLLDAAATTLERETKRRKLK